MMDTNIGNETKKDKKNKGQRRNFWIILLLLIFSLLAFVIGHQSNKTYISEIETPFVKVIWKKLNDEYLNISNIIENIGTVNEDSLAYYKAELRDIKKELDYFSNEIKNFDSYTEADKKQVYNRLIKFINEKSTTKDKIISFGREADKNEIKSLRDCLAVNGNNNQKMVQLLDKINELEKRNSKREVSSDENTLLRNENTSLRAENASLRAENNKLKDSINKINNDNVTNASSLASISQFKTEIINKISSQNDYRLDNIQIYFKGAKVVDTEIKRGWFTKQPTGFGIKFKLVKNEEKLAIGKSIEEEGEIKIDITEISKTKPKSEKVASVSEKFSYETKMNIDFDKIYPYYNFKKGSVYKIEIRYKGQILGGFAVDFN